MHSDSVGGFPRIPNNIAISHLELNNFFCENCTSIKIIGDFSQSGIAQLTGPAYWIM
jgi:hypothetical protein